jgi:hypothetical protein
MPTPRLARLLAVLLGAALGSLAPAVAGAQTRGPYDTFTVPPCRVLDTRFTAAGPLNGNQTRNIAVAGVLTGYSQGGAADCGVPEGIARGVYINVVAVTAQGESWLTIFPYAAGAVIPNASSLNFQAGQTVANGILVPICVGTTQQCPFDLILAMGFPAGAHIVIDVTGYLAPVAP